MHCKNDYRPLLAGVFVSIIFGLSFLFTKEGLDVLEPFHLLSFRFALAAIAFVALRILGIAKIDLKREDLRRLLFLTLLEPVIYFICETIGIDMTSSSEAAMVIASVPVFAAVIGVIYLKEKPTVVQVGFIMLSVIGVVFMTVMKGNIHMSHNVLGTFILLGSAISAAAFNVVSRKMSKGYSPVEITYMMVWVGAIVFNGISVIQHVSRGTLHEYFYHCQIQKRCFSNISSVFSSVLAYFYSIFYYLK